MRILAVTDSHLTMRNPQSRKDIYYDAILEQWRYLGEAAAKHNAVAILHAGDVFDTPKISNRLAGWLTEIIRDFPCKVYAVPGNHDIFGHNIQTLDQTMFGLLAKAGVFISLTNENPMCIESDNIKIKLHGREYHSEIDKRDWHIDYDIDADPYVDYNFLVVHGMLSDTHMPDFISHTHIDTIKTTSADLVLAGHNHNGFENGIVRKNNRLFINPGDMARKDATSSSMKIPEYVVIEITVDKGIQAWLEPFSTAESWENIFDMGSINAKKDHGQWLDTFKSLIVSGEKFENLDIFSVLDRTAIAMQLSDSVKQQALNEIQIAQNNDEDNRSSIVDYEYTTPITISWIHIINFQSHETTEIDFANNGLNAILGISDQGKTAIIRALRWVLYNDPQGSDFIKTGQKFCEVSVGLSNGAIIKRRRTEKNSGEYEIIEPNGKGQIFSSFGTNVPPDIFATHQMPLVPLQKGVEKSLNISYQLDGPFLLSESPLVRAAAIGKLVGAQAVDAAIKEISRQIGSIQREITTKIEQKEKAEKQLVQFTNLPQLENKIIAFEFLLQKYDFLVMQIEQRQEIHLRLDRILQNKSAINKQLDRHIFTDDAIVELSKIEDIHEEYQAVSVLEKNFLSNSTNIFCAEKLLSLLPNMQLLQAYEKEIDRLLDIVVSIKQLESKMISCVHSIERTENLLITIPDNKTTENICSEIDSIIASLQTIKTFQSQINNVDLSINNIKTLCETADKNFAMSYAVYEKVLRTTKQCPLCLSEINEHVVSHILSEIERGNDQ